MGKGYRHQGNFLYENGSEEVRGNFIDGILDNQTIFLKECVFRSHTSPPIPCYSRIFEITLCPS